MKHVLKKCNDMDPKDIVIALYRAGITQADLAHKIGVSRQMVYLVIYGKAVSHKVRKTISETIGIDLKRLWPSTYLYGGNQNKCDSN